ncbi:PA domain-containing protein, partial [Mycolicibacterium diernhoferi]
MQFRSRSLVAVLSATALAVGVSGCGKEDRATPAPEYAEQIGQSIGVEAMVGHLTRLQEIADQHGGNRAMGTPGYQGSVDYVVNTLRDKGFETDTQEFEVRLPFAEEPDVTVGGTEVTAKPLSFTVGTGPDGVSGPLVAAPVDETPGCADADYEGLPVSGAVVLVDRGSCQFGDKQTIAAKRGAVALIVA